MPFTTRSWLLALLCVPLLPEPAARPLYMPRAVKQAFENGTRSPDGRPGSKYWQNHARYSITVTAMPPGRTIRGTEQITYSNHSPDTLHSVVIKLFLNIHKPGAPRNRGADEAYLTSGVHIDAFAVNGHPTPWEDSPRYFTWQPVRLPTPLTPGDSIWLSFDWHYDVSRQSGREGMIDSTTYFLAYFYPRVAVYDDYNGWDRMNFTDQQEFYSDFNDYDVSVTVPANYVVWGTGSLLNPSAVLQPAYLQRYQASLTSDETVRVATKEELAARSVTLQAPTNTWHFKADNVPDMAFGLSDHFDWDAASVVVDDATHRRASVQAAYNDTSADFHHMVQFGRHALDWMSRNWPGVPYPYEKTTVFQGFAGMEYPMMVNDESYADTTFSRFVAEHEIAHTYFPFYMGINESRYGFMDEGWATTFEYLIGRQDMGAVRAGSFFKQFRVDGWIRDASALQDLPIITPADILKDASYGNNAYGKAALGYLAVKDMLGDAVFRKSLHEFMDRWHGKHPIPWDFFNTFNDVTGKNLDWFWHNWYFSNNYIDLALRSVEKSGSGYSVVVDNIGGMAAPVDLRVRYSDGSTGAIHETPAIWESNQRQATVAISTSKAIQSLELDGGIWVDADPTNNGWVAR
ncbi:MAG TPA: M1 family metallopeptidase [Gemmatimonadaceae bacterium]